MSGTDCANTSYRISLMCEKSDVKTSNKASKKHACSNFLVLNNKTLKTAAQNLLALAAKCTCFSLFNMCSDQSRSIKFNCLCVRKLLVRQRKESFDL